MKIIKYEILLYRNSHGDDILSPVEILCTDDNLAANEEIAKAEAYNGEYAVEDAGVEENTEPSQLNVIEAQVAYTAMMTDTLLEV